MKHIVYNVDIPFCCVFEKIGRNILTFIRLLLSIAYHFQNSNLMCRTFLMN